MKAPSAQPLRARKTGELASFYYLRWFEWRPVSTGRCAVPEAVSQGACPSPPLQVELASQPEPGDTHAAESAFAPAVPQGAARGALPRLGTVIRHA